MPDVNSTVEVIDGDPDLGASVGRPLRSLALDQLSASALEFLKTNPSKACICLGLDVRLPGRSRLDLQRDPARANRKLPCVFITGHSDVEATNLPVLLASGELLEIFSSDSSEMPADFWEIGRDDKFSPLTESAFGSRSVEARASIRIIGGNAAMTGRKAWYRDNAAERRGLSVVPPPAGRLPRSSARQRR